MADINDIRAQLREIRHHPAAGGAHGNLTFYLIAGLAVTVGFGIVLFVPKIYSVQRTASLPAFHETISREAAVPPAKTLAAAAQPAGASNYTGKSAEEVAGVADAVCAQQNAGSGADSFTQQNEQLHCFLSEAPARFC